MAKSTIKTLPSDILEKLQSLLRDPRVTQLEATRKINEILEGQGEAPVSKSAVNRYSRKMEEVGAKLRQSREIAEMWIGKLGAEPQGKIGHLVNEIVRNLAFETAMGFAEGDEPVEPKALKDLSLAVARLETAASENVKREKAIRREAAKDAAETAGRAIRAAGISPETEAVIKDRIMGIA